MQAQANEFIWVFVWCVLPMFVMFIKVFIVWEVYVLLTFVNRLMRRKFYGR